MTKEQKKEFLQYLENLKIIQADDFYREGLDMAISALSTEGEYIKKSELLQHVTTEELSDFKDCDVIHAEEIDELTTYSFPDSAENKREWIPVSERLPEEGETVLVCYRTQGGIAQSVSEWFDMPNRGIIWSTLSERKPIAWQPLPDPYKAESEGE